jgi:hypothetical protein
MSSLNNGAAEGLEEARRRRTKAVYDAAALGVMEDILEEDIDE